MNVQSIDPILSMDPVASLGFVFLLLGILSVLAIAFYVYTSLAYVAIAKKLGMKNPYLAWVPGANMYLMAQMAEMPTWPAFLMIGLVIPMADAVCAIILGVYTFIWGWKILERVGRPGNWILWSLIPFIGTIVFLILLGVAAWGKEDKINIIN
jgi:hypothetical protein